MSGNYHLCTHRCALFYRDTCSNSPFDQGFIPSAEDETHIFAEELKQSCTNVMLQCLDPESRLIYVLGVMFRMDSKVCGEILEITPEAYRQRLSRIRRLVGSFLSE